LTAIKVKDDWVGETGRRRVESWAWTIQLKPRMNTKRSIRQSTSKDAGLNGAHRGARLQAGRFAQRSDVVRWLDTVLLKREAIW